MRYIDTSVLVTVLSREERTFAMQQWLAEQVAGDLMVSDWVVMEFASALSIKLRTGQLLAQERAEALAQFDRLIGDSFDVVAVSRADFRMAARLSNNDATGLRAADALHLAVASANGATIHSRDRSLILAADALGISAELV